MGREALYSFQISANISKFSTFFKSLVFQIRKMIFQSFELFVIGDRYYFISRSSHVCVRLILKISIFFGLFPFLLKNSTGKIIFAKSCLSSEELIIIWMKIIWMYSPRNESGQIDLFVDIYSRGSYELTKISANFRNCTFSEISEPAVECFAPFKWRRMRNKRDNNTKLKEMKKRERKSDT